MNGWERLLFVLVPFAILAAIAVWVASLYSVLADTLAGLTP